jgi:hypothetical protein
MRYVRRLRGTGCGEQLMGVSIIESTLITTIVKSRYKKQSSGYIYIDLVPSD